MNNEDYLREIVREAVEDVLYEFKSDIAASYAARDFIDRTSGEHRAGKYTTKEDIRDRRRSTLDNAARGGLRSPGNYEPRSAHNMRQKRDIDNINANAVKNFNRRRRTDNNYDDIDY
jgi:hypothetical protein